MSENLVREIHDAVALSSDPVQASVRPPGTTPRQLRAMKRDVLRKLDLAPSASVVEIGCGTGLIGIEIAKRASRYVGVDFAPHAVEVFQARLADAGLGDRARVVCLNVLDDDPSPLHELGHFDRMLMYAVLHYARSEREAHRFLARALLLLRPGGHALVGNLPLSEQQAGSAPSPADPSLGSRIAATIAWVAVTGGVPVRLTRRWRLRRALELALASRAGHVRAFAPSELPPAYTISLTAADVERWLAQIDLALEHRWCPPGPGVPLAEGRADLLINRVW